MPKYRITAPDGHTLEITAPDGASQADVLAYAQKNYQPSTAPANGQDQGAGGAFLHGLANTATFGLADKGLALMESGLSHITPGPNESYDEALQNVQRTQGATAEAHPIANIAGDVAGAVGTGSALERGAVAAASKVAPNAVRTARSVLTLQRGEPVKNLLRLAGVGSASGALYGGAQGAVEGAQDDGVTGAVEQGAEGAGLGGVVGAVAGPAGAGLVKGAVAAKDIFGNASKHAIKILAKRIDETPSQLMSMISDFKSSTGRAPSIAEILGAKSLSNLSPIPASFQDAGLAAQNAARENAATLPKRLSGQIKSAGAPTDVVGLQTTGITDVATLRSAQNQAMNDAMEPIRHAPVALMGDDLPLLADQRVRAVVRGDPELRGKYNDLIDSLTDSDGNAAQGAVSNALSVNDFENLRLALRGRQQALSNSSGASYNPVRAKQFGQLADAVSQIARDQVPEYGQALADYGAHARFIHGFEHASAGREIGSASDLGDIATLSSPEGRMGLEVGARSRLVQQAGSSERGALRTADEMRQDAGLNDRLSEQMGARAAPLRRTGAAEAQASENLSQLAPGSVQSREGEFGQQAKTLLETVAAVGGHTLTGFRVHALARFVTKAQMRPVTAKKIVGMLVDPNQRDAAIRMLGNARVSQRKIYDILHSAAQASGYVGATGGNQLRSSQ